MVENTYNYLTIDDKISMVMDKIRFLETNIYSNNLDKQINVDPETISTLDNSIEFKKNAIAAMEKILEDLKNNIDNIG